MPTPTYTPLATVTLGSSASSVTFSSIPATYRDLIVIVDGKTSLVTNTVVRLNSDSGSNYSYVVAEGNGTSATSFSGTGSSPEVGRMATLQSNVIIEIMDYSATDKHKTILGRGNSSGDLVRMSCTRWANTAAVNSVQILPSPSPRTFDSGATFNLYGVIS
jgi:hypothetical protein